jgi:hypothetical protein
MAIRDCRFPRVPPKRASGVLILMCHNGIRSLFYFQRYLQVDAVDPHIHDITARRLAPPESVRPVLPLHSQPGERRRRALAQNSRTAVAPSRSRRSNDRANTTPQPLHRLWWLAHADRTAEQIAAAQRYWGPPGDRSPAARSGSPPEKSGKGCMCRHRSSSASLSAGVDRYRYDG